jgi:hypothetical protein
MTKSLLSTDLNLSSCSNVIQPAKLGQSHSDYFSPSANHKVFKTRDEQSVLLFIRMLEAENDSNLTVSSQPAIFSQTAMLDIDETCINA